MGHGPVSARLEPLVEGVEMMDDIDCTCISVAYMVGLVNYPCPVHGYLYASEQERIEMLENRMSEVERRLEER